MLSNPAAGTLTLGNAKILRMPVLQGRFRTCCPRGISTDAAGRRKESGRRRQGNRYWWPMPRITMGRKPMTPDGAVLRLRATQAVKFVIEEFHRIKRLPPYVFAEVNRLKAAARARGADIIDLGMGNPDMPTPQAHRRQAGRDGRQAAHPPLLGLQGHSGPAQGRRPRITRAASA